MGDVHSTGKKESSSGKARTSNLLIATDVTVRRASQLRHRGLFDEILNKIIVNILFDRRCLSRRVLAFEP
jgi:hypothetical protein